MLLGSREDTVKVRLATFCWANRSPDSYLAESRRHDERRRGQAKAPSKALEKNLALVWPRRKVDPRSR